MVPTNNGRALTSRDAAEYLSISESWLRKSRLEGAADAPPFYKVGRAVRYLRDDLDAWLATRRRRSTAEGKR